LIARRTELLNELSDQYENAHALSCDVTDAVAMKAAFGHFVDQSGRLDALFNNAGMFVHRDLLMKCR
jgi:NADP-dependent 3-hydroxy acid dehydrogenase YdfG